MGGKLPPEEIPDIVLILGTDASGKDYVAHILTGMIRKAGGQVEKRARLLSGRPTTEKDSSKKGWWDTLQEKIFLTVFRYLGWLMPFLVTLIICWDLLFFMPPAGQKLVVVGHNGLRALAFHLGHCCSSPENIRLPSYLTSTLRLLVEKAGVHVVVLDVEDQVRQRRISSRLVSGNIDSFDRYMRSDSVRSERIEACLVHLAVRFLDGHLIENNDLSREELCRRLMAGFSAS